MTSGWAPYLDEGERLVWEGQPATGLRFRPSDLLQSGFGLIFFCFSVFWVSMAASSVGDGDGGVFRLVFPLFGLPFVAVGAYLLFGRFFWSAHVRRKTRYALTNKRAIVATSAFGRSLKSWPITAETRLEFEPGDQATIWFHEEERRGSKGRRYTVKKGFEYVSGGDELYRLMRSVQQGTAA